MEFIKVSYLSNDSMHALYADCIVEVTGRSDAYITGINAVTGETLSFRAARTQPWTPGEGFDPESLKDQPCYHAPADAHFEVGDWIRDKNDNDGTPLKVRSVDLDGILLKAVDSTTDWRFVKLRADMAEKLDPEDAVGFDYLTDDPIFEANDSCTERIYGFNRYGDKIVLGYILPMNFDNDRVARCECCDDRFDRDSEYFDDYWHSDGSIEICEDCYENDYVTCSCCDTLVRTEDAYFDDNTEEYYCCNCWEEHNSSGRMHDYGYKPSPIFHQKVGGYRSSIPYMGVELEIDKGNSVSKCLSDLGELSACEDLFYCKHDGSLNDGIEIVTHPCDLQYHLEEFPWEEVTQAAKDNGFKSHDAKTCGLHVHVSRDGLGDSRDLQDLNIAKIIILMDRFWDEMVKFSRRDYEQLNHWAKKPNAKIYSYDDESTAVEKSKNSSAYDRYKAVNLGNRNTVEFRLFRGTLEKTTIFATLQFLSNLIGYVKNASLAEVQETRWGDITGFCAYPELSAYLEKRDLVNVPDKPKAVEPKPIPVRFNADDVVWFQTENTDNRPMRGRVQTVDVDRDRTLQPLYVVEDDLGHINFLIDEEIFDNDRIAELEAENGSTISVPTPVAAPAMA